VEIKAVIRDGHEQLQLKCPECNQWADIDEDQAAGRVSCICENCGKHFHTNQDHDVNIDIQT
jgi:Zn finger protein HypA/HybF involved in hydrogenase expression